MLPYDVEYSICKIFERELGLIRGLELVLSDLKLCYDFNVSDIFNVFDLNGFNYFSSDK